MKRGKVRFATSLLVMVLFGAQASAQDTLVISNDRPAYCVVDSDMRWMRIQCDKDSRVCLSYYQDQFVSTMPCWTNGPTYEQLLEAGYGFVQATPEAPPGYWRTADGALIPHGYYPDEDGELMQVSFDLRRRFYLGASYNPTFMGSDLEFAHRPAFDMGFSMYTLDREEQLRHRVRLFEGELLLNPLQIEATAIRYDRSQHNEEPLLRIVEFFGEPSRHDVYSDIGFGFRSLSVRQRSFGVAGLSELGWMDIYSGWDIWQGPDLTNFLRLRVGPGLRNQVTEDAGFAHSSVVLDATFEGQWSFDHNGLSHLNFDVSYETPWFLNQAIDEYGPGPRVGGQVEFERILISLNDQPLSWVASAEGFHQSHADEGLVYNELRATTGLRFSLWAPVLPEPVDE